MFTADARADDGIEVRYQDETVRLSQKMMSVLFDVSIPTINEHLKNIFSSQKLEKDSVIREFLITASDGKRYKTKHYNLDAIIAIWYRANSHRATQFRQWATRILREFAIKGYVLDRPRLENGTFLNEEYYERLLEEIREIRLSERKFYQKISDIYVTSVDYNKDDTFTKKFFAKVQTSSTIQYMDILPLNWFNLEQMQTRKTCDLPHEKPLHEGKYSNLMLVSQKTI